MASKRSQYEIALVIGGKMQSSFGQSINQANNGFDSIAKAAKTAAKIAAAAFAAVKVGQFVSGAVETYSEFEQTMAQTAATASATKEEYEALEKAALEMGKKTTKTASDSARALGYMALAGWDTQQSIKGLEPILRLSEATQMDLAIASDLVTDSMSALQIQVDDLEGYLDVAAKANNKSNQTAQQLMEAYIGVGGTLSGLNVPIQSSSTALGVLANRGIKGSEAGNKLNSTLLRMTSGTGEAGKKMKELGISAFDSEGKFIGLQETLELVNSATKNMSDKQRTAALAAIGGKTQIDTLNALLGGLNTTVADGSSEWNSLEKALNNSDGAMKTMSNSVTDTLPGAFERLNSAIDDSKINFVSSFADEFKDTINKTAEKIPLFTQKFINFSEKQGPKFNAMLQKIKKYIKDISPTVIKTSQSIGKGFKETWEFLSPLASFVLKNPGAIAKFIIGIAVAIKSYQAVNNLMNLAKGFSSLSIILTNPFALAIAAVAGAIALIATNVYIANKKAKSANLAEHFGSISLSFEDLERVAKHIVHTDNLGKLSESLRAFRDMSKIKNSINDAVEAINKMNWKVSIGIQLNENELDLYQQNITSFINDTQELLLQKEYALSLTLDVLVGNDEKGQAIKDKFSEFYHNYYSVLTEEGAKLGQVVSEALSDKMLDIDEAKTIAEMQSKIARITEKLAGSQFEAQLEVLGMKFNGNQLDPTSFQNLQVEITKQMDAAVTQFDESLQISIASAKVMLEDGAIDNDEYQNMISVFKEKYLEQVGEIELKAANFQLNTIMSAYDDELSKVMPEFKEKLQIAISDTIEYVDITGYGMAGWHTDTIQQWLNLDSLDKSTKAALTDLFKEMEPSLDKLKKLRNDYTQAGMEVPLSIAEGINDISLIGAITKNENALWTVIENTVKDSTTFKTAIESMYESGTYVPQSIVDAIKGNETKLIEASNQMYSLLGKSLDNKFSAGFNLKVPLNISTDFKMNNDPLGLFKNKPEWRVPMAGIDSYAEGGIVMNPTLTTFAEKSPEAAIPIDGSKRSISLWEKTGQLLGVLDNGISLTSDQKIYDGITSGQNKTINKDESKEQVSFTYAPVVNIQGNANEEDIEKALSMSEDEFEHLMEGYLRNRSRVAF